MKSPIAPARAVPDVVAAIITSLWIHHQRVRGVNRRPGAAMMANGQQIERALMRLFGGRPTHEHDGPTRFRQALFCRPLRDLGDRRFASKFVLLCGRLHRKWLRKTSGLVGSAITLAETVALRTATARKKKK